MGREIVDTVDEYVLAIDPALSTTGYAVINTTDLDIAYAAKYTTSSKLSDIERIGNIVTALFAIAAQYNVKDIVLEDGFLGTNPRTCIQLSMLRGAIIGAFQICKYSINMMQPSVIRMELGCGGNAKKDEVAQMVSEMYKGHPKLDIIGPYSDKHNKFKTSDIYDAISIGVAFTKKYKGVTAWNGKT